MVKSRGEKHHSCFKTGSQSKLWRLLNTQAMLTWACFAECEENLAKICSYGESKDGVGSVGVGSASGGDGDSRDSPKLHLSSVVVAAVLLVRDGV